MSAHTRDSWIDTLRGVSIFLVLLHHFNIAYPPYDTFLADLFGWPVLRAVARNGNYGVTMFFVISGFLITRNALHRWGSLDRIRLRTFYPLRLARILPTLLLLLLVVDTFALAGVKIFDNRPDTGSSLWTANVAALTAWKNLFVIRHGWINYSLGVLWSLSVELAFYLLFPLACLKSMAAKRRFHFGQFFTGSHSTSRWRFAWVIPFTRVSRSYRSRPGGLSTNAPFCTDATSTPPWLAPNTASKRAGRRIPGLLRHREIFTFISTLQSIVHRSVSAFWCS